MRKAILVLLALASILCLGSMPAMCTEKTITDMEGRTVTVSEPIERVVTAGETKVPCIMAALGVGDMIVGTGGATPKTSGIITTTPGFLIPAINNVTNLGRTYEFNVEGAAALKPNLIIFEADCAGQGDSINNNRQLIEKLELFNKSFPLAVLKNGACANPPSPDNIYREIEILGWLFDKQAKAKEIVDFLKEEVELVKQRTDGIKEEEKPKVLFGNLQAWSSTSKGSLMLITPDYDCATLYPGITKIKNAYPGQTRVSMSAEQLLNLDPDVIILLYNKQEWKAEDIRNETEYKAIQEMKAIKNKRVYSTGQLELYRSEAGLEFPIEMLIEAKAAYPDRFKDINVGEQLAKHYKALYGLTDEQAKDLKKCMLLDWMDEEGF